MGSSLETITIVLHKTEFTFFCSEIPSDKTFVHYSAGQSTIVDTHLHAKFVGRARLVKNICKIMSINTWTLLHTSVLDVD